MHFHTTCLSVDQTAVLIKAFSYVSYKLAYLPINAKHAICMHGIYVVFERHICYCHICSGAYTNCISFHGPIFDCIEFMCGRHVDKLALYLHINYFFGLSFLYIEIYRREMDPPVNQAQRPCILLHQTNI